LIDNPWRAGWVVEVTTQPAKAPGESAHTVYFDVAIKSASEATAAAIRKSGIPGATGRTVRPLTTYEIEVAGLKAGEARQS
jgi:hypothetical protein